MPKSETECFQKFSEEIAPLAPPPYLDFRYMLEREVEHSYHSSQSANEPATNRLIGWVKEGAGMESGLPLSARFIVQYRRPALWAHALHLEYLKALREAKRAARKVKHA